MKSVTRLFIIAITALATVLFISNAALAGIADTVHNLSVSNNTSSTIHANAGQQNDQICIWCHTPHAANVAFQGAPLWNKTTVSTSSFSMYGPTIAGTAKPTGPNAVSLACLSCHDGVDAINRLINQAGSGGYNSAGYDVAFGTTNAGTPVKMPLASVDNIGTDLTNDHPISITYTPGNASLKAIDTTLTGTWVGATKISDLLFNDGPSGAPNQIECASCHDPHTSVNKEFLRVSNAGSTLCLGCHDK